MPISEAEQRALLEASQRLERRARTRTFATVVFLIIAAGLGVAIVVPIISSTASRAEQTEQALSESQELLEVTRAQADAADNQVEVLQQQLAATASNLPDTGWAVRRLEAVQAQLDKKEEETALLRSALRRYQLQQPDVADPPGDTEKKLLRELELCRRKLAEAERKLSAANSSSGTTVPSRTVDSLRILTLEKKVRQLELRRVAPDR